MLALLNPTISSAHNIAPFTYIQEAAQTSPNTTNNERDINIRNENMTPSSSSAVSVNSNATVTSTSTSTIATNLKNARPSFPSCLHFMLSQADSDGYTDIASWQPHGRAFRIHKHKEFMEDVMPRMFRQSKWSSFQRQINLYRFNRITTGPDKGAYYHESFLRGNADLAAVMVRTRVKGTRVRKSSRPEQDPDFYAMPSAEALLKTVSKTDINKNASKEENNDHHASDDDSSSSTAAAEEESKMVQSTMKIVPQTLESIPSSHHVVSLPPSRVSSPKDNPATHPILPKKNLRKTYSSINTSRTTPHGDTPYQEVHQVQHEQQNIDGEFSHLLNNTFASTIQPKVEQQKLSFTTITSTPNPLSNLLNVVEPDSSLSSSSSRNDVVDDDEFHDLLKDVFGRSSTCDKANNFVPTGTNTATVVSSSSSCEELLFESTLSLQQEQQEGDDTMHSYDTEWGNALDSLFD